MAGNVAAQAGSFDSSWYLDVVGFAHATPWLHAAAVVYTVAGFVVLALLLLAAGLRARHGSAAAAAAALAAPVGVLGAYGVSELVKTLVQEVRPCDTLHVAVTVLPCDPPTDYSFPSNHSAIAAALAVAVLTTHRGLGWVAVPFALLMGLSRVYVGAHYPHDVVAGLALGALVAFAVGYLAPPPRPARGTPAHRKPGAPPRPRPGRVTREHARELPRCRRVRQGRALLSLGLASRDRVGCGRGGCSSGLRCGRSARSPGPPPRRGLLSTPVSPGLRDHPPAAELCRSRWLGLTGRADRCLY
jgi:membrane-associated phospholipid phosphatase